MSVDGTMPGMRRSRNALSPEADVEITIEGRRIRAAILDVSLSGLRVLRPQGVLATPGQAAELAFPLDADPPVYVRGSVVRSSTDQIAFRFDLAGGPQDEALRALIQRRGQLRDNYD